MPTLMISNLTFPFLLSVFIVRDENSGEYICLIRIYQDYDDDGKDDKNGDDDKDEDAKDVMKIMMKTTKRW